jgi:hypothetical protein
MVKRILLTSTIAMSSLTTGLHFTSHAYLAAERYVVGVLESKYKNTIEGLARDYGFEKPKPEISESDKTEILKRECKINDVPYSLARAVMRHESADNRFAISSAGAIGLMQVMPEHVKYCSLKHKSQLFDEEENIKCGVRILREAMKNQKGNVIMALKEYNAGMHRIDKSEENRKYPHLVLSKLE